jgi:hypothetical protein
MSYLTLVAYRKDFGNVIGDLLVMDDDGNIDMLRSLRTLAARLHSASTSGPGVSWESICDDLTKDSRASVLATMIEQAESTLAEEDDDDDEEDDDDDEEEKKPIDYRDELLAVISSANKWADAAAKKDRALSDVKSKLSGAEEGVERLQRRLDAETQRAESLHKMNQDLRQQLKDAYERETTQCAE